MKKVVLLGDSIKAWYTKPVIELLKDKCEILYIPQDNGRFTYYSVRQLMEIIWKHGEDIDLVHFNCGYWDMSMMPILNEPMMTIDEYISGLKKIIKLSRATGAKLIFATTTPLPASGSAQDNTGTGSTFVFEQERVKIYNDAAIKLMEEENIPINDLYSVCKQDARYYKCEDNLHHTEEGNRVLAQHVANAILKELGME
jgi:lysophospholipase L1-like esterase